jgi:hypothetical protein
MQYNLWNYIESNLFSFLTILNQQDLVLKLFN